MSSNAYVIYPDLKKNEAAMRTPSAQLEEAVGLTRAMDVPVKGAEIVPVREIKPATYIGSGAINRIKPVLKENNIDVVIMDCALSPIQQRNLEKAWDCKVIDRTALILEIFGQRARTKEGVLQVELAHLTYQRSRLVRSWTHLERQRGSLGFIGGPGETQIEIDRRLIDERLVKIKKELEQVKRTRFLQRSARKRVPYRIVALVGYTNAGKSTLFNKLTNADVFAKDLLFATLDPTMRQIKLPSGRMAILSDTVGFISQLPTELVAAFHATLEEVLEADLILHVRDISHPDTAAQKQDVENVLKNLGLKEVVDHGLKEVLNKTDLLDADERHALNELHRKKERYWPVSALTGQGLEALLEEIDKTLYQDDKHYIIRVSFEDGKTLAWLHEKGRVVRSTKLEENMEIEVYLSEKDFRILVDAHPELVFVKA